MLLVFRVIGVIGVMFVLHQKVDRIETPTGVAEMRGRVLVNGMEPIESMNLPA